MRADEYAALDATAIADAIHAGDVRPDEILSAATERHEEVDDAIHAVVEWYPDPTTASARPSHRGRLAGVPILRKDYGSTEAGRLVEMGSRLAAGVVADETSPFHQRLLDAGASIVGRSAVPELIQHGTTESRAFGVTRHPNDPSLSAGGSSGGAAAAVAAGVVPAAHASDCAGSIRIPAAACGLVGLKPSRRLVPWPDGGWGGVAEEFVVTRTLRDTACFLDVLGGPRVAAPAPASRWAGRGHDDAADRARIAVSTEHWAGSMVDPAVVEWTERAAERISAAGHEIEVVDIPISAERLMTTWNALFSRWVAHDVAVLAERTGRPVDETTLEPTTLLVVDAVRAMTVPDVTRAQIEAGRITFDLDRRLAGFDAILTPTLGRATIPLDHVHGEVVPFERYLRRNSDLFPFSFLFNVTGWPSLAIPVDGDGPLPGSVQLSARPGSDRRLLELAEPIIA